MEVASSADSGSIPASDWQAMTIRSSARVSIALASGALRISQCDHAFGQLCGGAPPLGQNLLDAMDEPQGLELMTHSRIGTNIAANSPDNVPEDYNCGRLTFMFSCLGERPPGPIAQHSAVCVLSRPTARVSTLRLFDIRREGGSSRTADGPVPEGSVSDDPSPASPGLPKSTMTF